MKTFRLRYPSRVAFALCVILMIGVAIEICNAVAGIWAPSEYSAGHAPGVNQDRKLLFVCVCSVPVLLSALRFRFFSFGRYTLSTDLIKWQFHNRSVSVDFNLPFEVSYIEHIRRMPGPYPLSSYTYFAWIELRQGKSSLFLKSTDIDPEEVIHLFPEPLQTSIRMQRLSRREWELAVRETKQKNSNIQS